MKDRELDQIVQKWADDETASAPKMRPTSEMYEQVSALGRKRALGLFLARRPAWATALAVVAILMLAFVVVQLPPLVAPSPSQQVAQVSQRPAFAPENGYPKGKGSRSGPEEFGRLIFQVRGQASAALRSVNVLSPQRSPVELAAEESYRLVVELQALRYVYVYQWAPDGELALLYPNEAYSPVENPIHPAQVLYLPAEPNGFYAEDKKGAYRLYVVVAERPVQALETLDARYVRPALRLGRRRSRALLLEWLDALVGGQTEGAEGWTLEFEVR